MVVDEMDRFSPEQIREYNDAFTMFDTDGSGDILVTELRDMLKTIGFNPTDETLDVMSIVVDEGGDGIINFDEFINLIDGLETFEKNEKESRDAYNAFDFLGQGYINSTDIMEALRCVLESKSEKDFQEVINFYNLVPSRKIDFKEFQKMVTTWGPPAQSIPKWERVDEAVVKKEKDMLYSP